MFLLASCPITGVVSTTTNACPDCPLLARHRHNANKMFKLLLCMY